MSANRYEIEDTCPGVIGVRLGANTWYVDDDQPEARAIRQLLADLAALTAERDALRAKLAEIASARAVAWQDRNMPCDLYCFKPDQVSVRELIARPVIEVQK